MRRLLLLCVLLCSASVASAQTVTLAAHSVITTAGDAYYAQGLASRHVAGQLRLLHLNKGTVYEFVPPADGQSSTATTGSWSLAGTNSLSAFNAIWYEEGPERLWVTSGSDYNATMIPAHLTTMTLGANGAVSNVKHYSFPGLPDKRFYGPIQPSPYPAYAYCMIGGGYTSLILQGGNASLGPAMYCFADPTPLPDHATLAYKTFLDAAPANQHHGVRLTAPISYFDCLNCGSLPVSTAPLGRPQFAPTTAQFPWLSPNTVASQGPLGVNWWTWGDSYYGTGAIATISGVPHVLAILSGCIGGGECWYWGSTLHYDGRGFELHAWKTSSLDGSNVLTPPDAMVPLTPLMNTRTPEIEEGNVTPENMSGATWADGFYWAQRCGNKATQFGGCDLYQFRVTAGTPPPPPPPPPPPAPVDQVVSAWSAWAPSTEWSVCAGGQQSRIETRTRTEVSPAQNGGQTFPLTETRTTTQACTVTPPPSTGVTNEDLQALLQQILGVITPPPPAVLPTCTVTSVSTYANGDPRITLRCPKADVPKPATGDVFGVKVGG